MARFCYKLMQKIARVDKSSMYFIAFVIFYLSSTLPYPTPKVLGLAHRGMRELNFSSHSLPFPWLYSLSHFDLVKCSHLFPFPWHCSHSLPFPCGVNFVLSKKNFATYLFVGYNNVIYYNYILLKSMLQYTMSDK